MVRDSRLVLSLEEADAGDGRAGHVRDVRTSCIGASSLAELQLVKSAVIPDLVTSYSLR